MKQTVYGLLIPFLGTTLGTACVFFMRKQLSDAIQRILTGFAAGVMVAASVWSLLIPAMEQAAWMGKLAFLPAFSGFWIGILSLLGLDHLIPHLHAKSNQAEGPKSQLKKTTMMVLAVTLHNIVMKWSAFFPAQALKVPTIRPITDKISSTGKLIPMEYLAPYSSLDKVHLPN